MGYLQACLEEASDDPTSLAAALADIARARGMRDLAKATGLTRRPPRKSAGSSFRSRICIYLLLNGFYASESREIPRWSRAGRLAVGRTCTEVLCIE